MKKTTLLILAIICSLSILAQNDTIVILHDLHFNAVGNKQIIIPIFDYDTVGNDAQIMLHQVSNPQDKLGEHKFIHDTLFYTSYFDVSGPDTLKHFLRWRPEGTTGLFRLVESKIIIHIEEVRVTETLDIGNISTIINSDGSLFWDHEKSCFEVPKNSGRTSIFNSSFWLGGQDDNGQLHLAGSKYNQDLNFNSPGSGYDYFRGPVSDVYDTAYYERWTSIWKLNKTDIEHHILHWNSPGYIPVKAIATWPAHGIVANGEMKNIAPFYDMDQDGIYNPMNGDFPRTRGDQAIFFVVNDDKYPHTETGGNPLRVQLHVMAYAFDQPEDELLHNSIFFHYDMFNKSDTDYQDTYFGIFTDFDLGYAGDDYIGCDVKGSSYYVYNGKEEDGNGQSWAYGLNPPAQGTTILAGPILESDQTDEAPIIEDIDFSYNGYGFGDGIIDNERMGMTNFMYFNNENIYVPDYMTDPINPMDYYNFLRSIWKDNSRLLYGGNGHPSEGGYGPTCRFMFPGDSDPDNWGTNGVEPNGSAYWTEVWDYNPPGNRKCMGSCGPFTFKADDVQMVDIAYIFAQDESNKDAAGSVELLRERIAEAQQRVKDGEIINLHESNVGQQEHQNKTQLMLYPNPAHDQVRVVFDETNSFSSGEYQIIDLNGALIKKGELINNSRLSVGNLNNGIYIIKVVSENQSYSEKLIIR